MKESSIMFDLFLGRVMEKYCKKLECNELPVANYFDEKMPHIHEDTT